MHDDLGYFPGFRIDQNPLDHFGAVVVAAYRCPSFPFMTVGIVTYTFDNNAPSC
jgi:hypothetical protein